MDRNTGFFRICWDNLLSLIVLNLLFLLGSVPLLLLLIFAVSALCSGRSVLPIIETTILKEK